MSHSIQDIINSINFGHSVSLAGFPTFSNAELGLHVEQIASLTASFIGALVSLSEIETEFDQFSTAAKLFMTTAAPGNSFQHMYCGMVSGKPYKHSFVLMTTVKGIVLTSLFVNGRSAFQRELYK